MTRSGVRVSRWWSESRCEYVLSRWRCPRKATVLVRETPPGNPYRDQRVCERHADEMVRSGFYFRVKAAA